MQYFGTAFTPTTAKHCMNALLPSSRTNPTEKLTTFKTCFKPLWQSSQVTMTFIFRSHPLEEMKPTTHENVEWNTPREAHKGRPMTGTLQGVTGTATLPVSKTKNQTIKKLWIKTTTSVRTEDTDTHLHASRQEPYDSKITAVEKRIRNWTT